MLRKVIVISVLFFPAFCISYSQDLISGVINQYLKVDSIYADTVVFSGDAGSFESGDKVLLIQMTGVELDYEGLGVGGRGIPNRGTRAEDHSTGMYEILQMDEIKGNKMVFTSDFLNSYDNGEKIQLVKVYETENAVINATLTATDWDGDKGGILALIVFDTLRFQANIDVSNKGFRGSLPETGFVNGCRTAIGAYPDAYDTINFFSDELNRAGNKGEGTVSTSFLYTKGAYWAATGGGGGNGRFAGGGGGSNYGYGGEGGKQTSACVPDYILTAMGGISGDEYYDNGRIVMGGGGGSGVQSTTTTASNGGDGGGIVIIAAGVVEGNNRSINANGEGVPGTATASGGGGGGGGAVLIDASTFGSGLTIAVNGGKGGNTGNTCTGTGGGGGGGVFWYSGNQKPLNYIIDTAGGAPGSHNGGPGCYTYGTDGGSGTAYDSLYLPLNGFLFNTIRGADFICQGQQPKPITGSQPKGGTGSYLYKWEQSTDNNSWSQATGTGTFDKDFQPSNLDTTTYFRRIVTLEDLTQSDTSKSVTVLVYPKISNNNIYGTDTICYNITPLPVTGDNPAGGDGVNYTYQWEHSTNLSAWTPETATSSNQPYIPGQLTVTQYYRRYVTSTAYCSDYSDTVTITVLPVIGNNAFKPNENNNIDTVICEGNAPGILRATLPVNGDDSFGYLWQQRETGSWTDIAGSNMPEISAGPLTTTTWFRRIVYSGNDNACIDTSGSKQVTVLESITGNTILTDSTRYCEGDTPEIISGSNPSGGDGLYTYRWLLNYGSSWEEIPLATGIDYSHGSLPQSVQFQRVVISGTYGACKDTTTPLNLTVIPALINSLTLANQTICEGNTPLSFNPAPATGGDGSYTYEWQVKPAAGGTWQPAQGTNNTVGYIPPSLTDSSLFIRKVTSDICTNFSDTVQIFVYKTIKNNYITGNQLKYACFNSSEQLNCSSPSDGNPGDYTYLWQMSDDLGVWTEATGKVPNNNSNFETADLTLPVYYRRIVFSSTAGKECADTSQYAQVLINELPTGSLISAQDTVCAGETIQIRYNVDGMHGPWEVTVGNESFSETGQSDEAGLDSISVTLTGTRDIRLLSVTDDSLCQADLTSASEIVYAVVYDIPDANAGSDEMSVCGTQQTLSAVKSIAGSAGLWQSGIGTFNDPTLNNAILTINGFSSGVTAGWLKWTETNWKCAASDSFYISFYEQPVDIDAGTDKMLNFEFQTTLDAMTPLFGSGLWTVSEGSAIFENAGLPNSLVNGLDWDNVLRWTVTNGACPSISDSVSILVKELYLPVGVTPGSGTSSAVFAVNIENTEKIELTIFNRLGQVVFTSDNYTEENFWDGTNKNNVELPEGTYFYVLKIKIAGKDNEFIFKRYIELLR